MATVGEFPHDLGRSGAVLSRSTVIDAVETPAFVVDERTVLKTLETARTLRERTGCKILYTLKPLSYTFLLELIRPCVDGFAVSSLFEAKLARSALGTAGGIHLTTPGLRASEIDELNRQCDYIAFNSLTQLARFAPSLSGPSKVGLRINPRLPFVDDDRYNPCRRNSKLGVPIGQVRRALDDDPATLEPVRGLHFHTNCESDTFTPLLHTVRHIEDRLGDWLQSLEWINLGGGYLLDSDAKLGPIIKAVEILKDRYGLEVFIEPGAAFVRDAGFLIAQVIDLFSSGGKMVAVLDTTVNHWPEIFEYQFEPDVLGHDDEAEHEYILAGSSCLAGDVLGVYGFNAPLELGSRIVLPRVGAYSQVKAHMFNGINLPTVYSVDADGTLVERRRFTYDDFTSRTGVANDASV